MNAREIRQRTKEDGMAESEGVQGIRREREKLQALVERINREHRLCEQAAGEALAHAINAGEGLVAMKQRVPHGAWGRWLAESFEGSDRTAQAYMRLYRRREEIRNGAADSSIRSALASLSAPQPNATPRADTTAESADAAAGLQREVAKRLRDAGVKPSFAKALAQFLAHRAEQSRRVELRLEKRAITQAVADAHGLPYENAQQALKAEVREVRNAVMDEAERRDERGETFDADERAEYARKLAEMKKRTREREARYREERRKRHTEMFLEVDAHLGRARREAKEALDDIRGVEFDEGEADLLKSEAEAAQGMLSLVLSALSGDSGTDWDAELWKLEDRRQWDDIPPEDR